MEFLLSQGADANRANKDGMLPLHVASKKGNYRSAQALPPPPSPQGRGEGGATGLGRPRSDRRGLWGKQEKPSVNKGECLQ